MCAWVCIWIKLNIKFKFKTELKKLGRILEKLQTAELSSIWSRSAKNTEPPKPWQEDLPMMMMICIQNADDIEEVEEGEEEALNECLNQQQQQPLKLWLNPYN